VSTLCAIAGAILSTIGAVDDVDAVRRLTSSGSYERALARATEILDGSDATSVARETRRELELFRARCLFELGRWPKCERSLRRLLETDGTPETVRAALLVELAKVHSHQSAHAEAFLTIDRALDIDRSESALRAATAFALSARRFDRARPHIDELLAKRPRDPYALFARGIVRSRAGEFDEAIEDLRHGLTLAGARRDARFELALAFSKSRRPRESLRHTIAILERDPFDLEACYQASRALLRLEDQRSARLAALLVKYFESLGAAHGSSSRAEHLVAAGRPSDAAAMRATRRERLGDLAGAVKELDLAVELAPVSITALAARARFRLRHGLLTISEDDIRSLESSASEDSPRASAAKELRSALSLARQPLRGTTTHATTASRELLSRSSWEDAAKPLRKLLSAARASRDTSTADDAARLLLARDPESVPALSHLLERTTDPTLIVPHLHYLRRLSDLPSVGNRFKNALMDVRRTLTGGAIKGAPEDRR
jgi:tetratricopeptide (TPR) repeat protein